MSEPVDIKQICSILPHRYPLIMVDRVLDYKPFEHLTAIKNVTINENFLPVISRKIQLCLAY